MLCQRCSALLTPGEPASQPQQNLAFEKALKQHTAKLSAEGKKSLSQANATSVEELIRQAEELDKKSNEHSFMRRRANRVRGVLRGINRYLDIVGVAIQHNPDISALVLGGCKLVLMVGCCPYPWETIQLTLVYRLGSNLRSILRESRISCSASRIIWTFTQITPRFFTATGSLYKR